MMRILLCLLRSLCHRVEQGEVTIRQRARASGRLSRPGVEMVGGPPHGLRHSAITAALDLTRGNVRAVQKFSRHRDVRVIERYDANRNDLAGQVARQLAATVPAEPPAA